MAKAIGQPNDNAPPPTPPPPGQRPNSYYMMVNLNNPMITPVIAFNTAHLPSCIPQLRSQLAPLSQMNPARVAQMNPANFPFTSFAPHAAWAMNSQSAIDIEVICSLPKHAAQVTHYSVFVDVAARWVGDAVDRIDYLHAIKYHGPGHPPSASARECGQIPKSVTLSATARAVRQGSRSLLSLRLLSAASMTHRTSNHNVVGLHIPLLYSSDI